MITPVIVPMRVAVSTVEIPMQVSTSHVLIPMSIDVTYVSIDGDTYDGPYTVTPKTQEQMLATRDKLMAENVLVLEIPYYETTNEQGGYTVIIADE